MNYYRDRAARLVAEECCESIARSSGGRVGAVACWADRFEGPGEALAYVMMYAADHDANEGDAMKCAVREICRVYDAYAGYAAVGYFVDETPYRLDGSIGALAVVTKEADYGRVYRDLTFGVAGAHDSDFEGACCA